MLYLFVQCFSIVCWFINSLQVFEKRRYYMKVAQKTS